MGPQWLKTDLRVTLGNLGKHELFFVGLSDHATRHVLLRFSLLL